MGTLVFDDSVASTTLRVQNLELWGGTIIAGNSTHPYKNDIKIEFWAFPWTKPVPLGIFLNAGSNVFAVMGRLELYGQERPIRWTRLRESSAAGSLWLYPDDYTTLDWVA
eukprot:scaffold37949_cov50-Prasinocladus_malaysianus.AAC.1